MYLFAYVILSYNLILTTTALIPSGHDTRESNKSKCEKVKPDVLFNPVKINSKLNSLKNVSVTLRSIYVGETFCEPRTNQAKLVMASGPEINTTVQSFQFDESWDALVPVELSKLGMYLYGVTINETNFDLITGGLSINVYRNKGADIFAEIIGWIYFVLWSVSFYPQVLLNFRRKSVIGLSFDYTGINVAGFLPFAIFNSAMYFSPVLQRMYHDKYPHAPIPVELNDVVFAIHATVLTTITAIQCFIYERGGQRLTYFGFGCISAFAIAIVIALILWSANAITLLSALYIFSYVKLGSTMVKYIPQAYFNFERKSTSGWSISNILMDISGGLASFLQQLVLSINYDNYTIIYGNMVKLLLGLASIAFDILFIVQHYVLYPKSRRQIPDEEKTGPSKTQD